MLVLMSAIGTACTPVAPWQRAHLAEPTMALDPNPLQNSLRNHHYGSREAAIGSHSSSGGGCGCY
ncbi:MAG: DUF4266 domain-containing protein [Methylococcaceae bacterium]